jgi:predicted RecB family endonuclease
VSNSLVSVDSRFTEVESDASALSTSVSNSLVSVDSRFVVVEGDVSDLSTSVSDSLVSVDSRFVAVENDVDAVTSAVSNITHMAPEQFNQFIEVMSMLSVVIVNDSAVSGLFVSNQSTINYLTEQVSELSSIVSTYTT